MVYCLLGLMLCGCKVILVVLFVFGFATSSRSITAFLSSVTVRAVSFWFDGCLNCIGLLRIFGVWCGVRVDIIVYVKIKVCVVLIIWSSSRTASIDRVSRSFRVFMFFLCFVVFIDDVVCVFCIFIFVFYYFKIIVIIVFCFVVVVFA